MRLIKPKFEIIEQQAGLEGMYKQIELAGRTCYKSEDKITEDSAKSFVDRMIASGHGAMLEHGTVYLAMPIETIIPIEANGWGKYTKAPYSKGFRVCSVDGEKRVAVTTNYRVLVENNWLDDLKYLCEPTEYHAKRITVYFTCDRVTGESFLRHRVFSFARESTRYCNYAKDKFGNELTFIEPCWIKDNQDTNDRWCFYESLSKSEEVYFRLLKHGWKPQQARVVLPFAVKSPLVMTGFAEDWKHFFDLRCATNAHPQAQELAIPLREEFVKKGYITDNK